MANVSGPGECRRRVYAGVVVSVILYGASIWTQTVMADRHICRNVTQLQRQLALRIIREYRIVSHEAVAILARIVFLDLLDRYRRIYLRRREILE